MIEQANELVAKFNKIVGAPILVESKALLSAASRLPGIDGKAKMSKSLGNAITLGASPDEIKNAVHQMYTDPCHLRVDMPGQVEGNVVFAFLDAFEPDAAKVAELKAHYRRGGLGDSVVKRILNERLQEILQPIRERRLLLENDKSAVMALLKAGTERARERAAATVAEVKRAMGLCYF
jgi:tryptophanyl-tRNA synthetase